VRFQSLLAIVAAAGLGAMAAGCGKGEQGSSSKAEQGPLVCYVGGTMRPAIEEIKKLYEAETGRRVDIEYGDSGQLLIRIDQSQVGDLYVCHDPFGGGAEKKNLARRLWTVASLSPMIAVPKGNPKKLQGLRDLAAKDIRLGLTDEKYSTLGHINPLMFDKAGLRKEIEANAVTRSRMGGEVANAVAIGQLDAAIVWDAVIHARRDKLDGVPIEPAFLLQPGVDAVTTATYGVIDMGRVRVTIATLQCSKQLEAATAFAEFVSSPKGRAVFAAHGFSPASEGPAPDEKAKGSLLLYCGAAIRPPVAEAAEAFEAETGISVTPDYSGSGILISRIKASGRGDLFMPGDAEYVDLAAKDGLIESRRNVCYFVPVILVQKGNPKGIRALADLARPGLRLGLGDSRACAVGKVCDKLFEKNGISSESIQKNLVVQTATVNELGVQIKLGHLDATIVWDAVAAQYPGIAESVPIPSEQNIVTQVPVAILRSSAQAGLAARFADFLAGERGQAIFRKHHYTTALPAR